MSKTPQHVKAVAQHAVIVVLLVAPWLNPFTPVPSPTVGPLLFTWACTAVLLLMLALRGPKQTSTELIRTLALAWILAAAGNAVIGLIQYFGWSTHFGVWLDHIGPGMAFGNLRQRNQFATLMSIGLAALLWWGSLSSRRTTWVLALSGMLLGAANAATSSRTGLLQWLLLALLFLAWPQRVERDGVQSVSWVVLAALLGYLVASLALPWAIGLNPLDSAAMARLGAGENGCQSRLVLWRNVLHLIGLKPWLGWGWGELDYAHFITLYEGPRFCDILDNAHNLPLHLAVELGVPVALLACSFGLWLIWCGRPWRETDPSRRLAWSVLAVIGLHSLLEYPLWYGPFQITTLACVIWLCWPELGGALTARRLRLDLVLAAGLILGLGTFAANDYRIARQIYLPPLLRAEAYREDTLHRSQVSWLYADYFRFAILNLMQLTPDNAIWARTLALNLLHFSPEAKVVRVLLDADRLLGQDEELSFYATRYHAAFTEDYARWKANSEASVQREGQPYGYQTDLPPAPTVIASEGQRW